ncbi:MAG: hypothetical protein AB1Z23_12520 [Eubacteriales bacterium]
MSRVSEKELVIPALYVISNNPNIKTSDLILELSNLINPTGEDLKNYGSRNDARFTQIVRNLVSHHKLDDQLGYTTIKGQRNGSHTITEKGKEYIEQNKDIFEYLIDNDFENIDIEDTLVEITDSIERKRKPLVYDENIFVYEGSRKTIRNKVYERSAKLRNIAIEYYTHNGVILCDACKFDFKAKYGARGDGYIEIHHQKPIYTYEEQDANMFIDSALKNVVPVCSNCHRMIHRRRNDTLTIEKLKEIISTNQNGGF